jgi:hypothetical protein
MKATLLAAILCAATVLPAVAYVVPGEEGNLVDFVRPVPGERVCFARNYSAAHLAKHPKQMVSSIKFFLTYFKHEPDEDEPQGYRSYIYRLAVQLRGRPGKTFKAVGDCLPGDGVIHCSVECDGGGVQVSWRKKPETILVDLRETGHIRLASCGGEDEDDDDGLALLPGADDRTFLLTRTSKAACPQYEKW